MTSPRCAAARGVDSTTGGDDQLAGDHFKDIADAAEEAVIGAMLAPPPIEVLLAAVGRLAPEDFGNPRARWLFEVIGRMVADGIPPDMVSLPGYVRQHAIDEPVLLVQHLGSICHEMASAAPVPASLNYYIDAVKAEAARRKLGAIGRKLATIALGGDSDDVARLLAAVEGLVTV